MTSSRKERIGWYFYDWANSAYPLVINTAIFPIYYSKITHINNSDYVSLFGFSFYNSALYSYTIALSYVLVSLITPIMSGIADYSGQKKRFLRIFCILGSLSCAALALFTQDRLMFGLAAVIGASIGFSGSLVFYNAFLPEIASPNEQDMVSARGFAMGYIGSSILLIVNILIIMHPEWIGINPAGRSDSEIFLMIAPWTFIMVAAWWIGWSQLTFRWLRDREPKELQGSVFLAGFRELRGVWNNLKTQPHLQLFLGAFFVYSMGVQTVILVSTFFGTQVIGVSSTDMVTIILLLQFVAIGGSYAFSWLSSRIGNVPSLMSALLVWIAVCLSSSIITTSFEFKVLSLLVGVVLGGTQSLSRSTYSKLLPSTHDHASYFSFFDVCEKVGIVFGMVVYGRISDITGNMRNAALSLAVFFIVGGALLVLLYRRQRAAASQVSSL